MIKPTEEHLNDPYVLQLIETISKLDDENERLRVIRDAAKVVVQDLDLMNMPKSCPDLRAALAAEKDDE